VTTKPDKTVAKTGQFIRHEPGGGFSVRLNELIRSKSVREQLTTTKEARERTEAFRKVK